MDFMRDIWMAGALVETGTTIAPESVALVNVARRAVFLGPNQSIADLTPWELLDRSIDWKETAQRSAIITNIGKESR